ncbi:MAG TPA: hypothetical protein VEK57_19775 [Thermoanaerobaculia bacterium]|nr:hypothetical protein [Thermoanaerobaculia bacterium]
MIVATVAALLALPLVVLRRRTLAAYLAVDAATWLFAWLLWRRFPSFDPYLGGVALAVLKVTTFSLFLARGRDVRWSANHAAAVAAIVYAVVIPTTLRTAVIDGDEPFYLLVTESLVHDGDLDLANQYRTLDQSETGRKDLVPQLGDPTGPNGEQYSRHEPFLPLLLVPGYALAGLHGAIATVALFGVLLIRSTVRWMEDEGISEEASRAVFPFFAFAPPVLFYATRIWPEVPAAFFFVEALRGARAHRLKRWLPALFGLVLLKLRFVLVAIGVVATMLAGRRASRRTIALAIAVVAAPLFVMWLVSGSPTSVHTWREILPGEPRRYAIGFFGLLADGMSGIAFRAPFYLLGLFALTQWKATPRGFRAGMLASLLYILYLLPRMEWFGGWAPPLRYLVFLMPVLALGAASVWDRISRGAIALISAWTVGLVIHGIAYPWRLFHISNGENPIGEWLSHAYRADFSRLFPSFIRENSAAWIGAAVVVLIVLAGVRRWKLDLAIPLASLALAAGFSYARQPASHVEFEDAHVVREGGELYPQVYQVMRVAYRGGYVLETGESLSFLAGAGTWRLEAITGLGATFELAGHAYTIAPDERYQAVRVTIPESGRVTLRCLSGAVNLDRMARNE